MIGVQSVMKTRHDNDVTHHTSAIYVENDTELSWPIGSVTDYDRNQIEQQCD